MGWRFMTRSLAISAIQIPRVQGRTQDQLATDHGGGFGEYDYETSPLRRIQQANGAGRASIDPKASRVERIIVRMGIMKLLS